MKQFNYLNNLGNNLKLFLFVIGITITITSCGNSGSSSSTNNITPPPQPIVKLADITIDSAGIIPILGESPTISKIYVHNNSNTGISGIIYYITDNSESNNSTLDYESCHYIAAGKSCALKFTTPNLSFSEAQGSMIITANYITQDGINNKFEQIINYVHIGSSTESGVVFSSGAQIFGESNTTHYITLYMYGSGANEIYKILGINSNNPEVTIIQGDITGQQIHSNEVQAIEITALAKESYFSSIITTYSQNISNLNQYSNNAIFNIYPPINQAILTAGTVPLIYSEVESPMSQLFIVNNGNESANISYIEYPIGVTEIIQSDSCTTAKSLNPHTSCSIHFNIPQNTNGEGNIVLTYDNESSIPTKLVQPIKWFNLNNVVLHMFANPNPLIFNVITGGEAIITINNVGDYDLTNVRILEPDVTEGDAYAKIIESSINCTAGESLPISRSCTYKISVTNSSNENGTIKLGMSGYYYNNGILESYSDTLNLHYTSYDINSLISMDISSNPVYFSVNTSKIVRVTVTNNSNHNLNSVTPLDPIIMSGTTNANIVGFSLICSGGGTNLPIGESCSYDVSVNSNGKAESGAIKLAISTYNGDENITRSEILNYTTVLGGAVYVLNSNSSNINQFTIDESTGILSRIDAVANVPGTNSRDLAINPNGRFLYATNTNTEASQSFVSTYKINENTGILEMIGVAGAGRNMFAPYGIAVHPNGKYAYVSYDTVGDNDIGVYSIDQSTGLLNYLWSDRAGGSAGYIKINTGIANYYAYVTDIMDNTTMRFHINSDGDLSDPNYFTTNGTQPEKLAVHPNTGFLYVNNFMSNEITMFQIDQTSGALLPNSPPTINSGGTSPSAISIDQTGKFLYTTNYKSNNVSIFDIDQSTGHLSFRGSFSTIDDPNAMAIDQSGKFLYIGNAGNANSVSMYRISESGWLESIGSAVDLLGTLPTAMVTR